MERFHEHATITSERYAYGLIDSWKYDKLNTFPFILTQADQGDLEEIKKRGIYKKDQEFSKAIDDAVKNSQHFQSRLMRLLDVHI